MTAETSTALRHTFRGDQSREEALEALSAFMHDKTNHGGHRLRAAEAMLDLRQGWSVDKNLARFRRDVGIDPPKGKPSKAR